MVALLLLAACPESRTLPPPRRADLTLEQAQLRSYAPDGLKAEVKAVRVQVFRGEHGVEAEQTVVAMVRSGVQIAAPRLTGEMSGQHFEADAGARLATGSGLQGATPEVTYRKGLDGGLFEGHHGVTLDQRDGGCSLQARSFWFDSDDQQARFEGATTVAGGSTR